MCQAIVGEEVELYSILGSFIGRKDFIVIDKKELWLFMCAQMCGVRSRVEIK